MLRPIESNTMNNAMRMNVTLHMNKYEILPILRNNSDSKGTMTSKRVGLRKFLRSLNTVNNICSNDSPVKPQPLTSTSRTISFTEQDEGKHIHERPLSSFHIQNRKTKKTVRFATQLSTRFDDTSSNQEVSASKMWEGTEEHCRELWYQKEELMSIKHAAKVIIANRAKVQRNPNASLQERDGLIGLERFNKRRAVWKKSAIRFVMMAQNEMRELNTQTIKNDDSISKEDYIRTISLRGSNWSRDAAKKQGFRDYCAVHDPLASLFSDSDFNNSEAYLDEKEENQQNYNELIFGETTSCNTSNKRKVGSMYDENNEQNQVDSDRRIRHRTIPPVAFLQFI